MPLPDLDRLIGPLRRAPVIAPPPPAPLPAVETLIPHRPPALHLDRLIGFDATAGTLLAERSCLPSDPAFHGHFPGAPVFPATTQTEAIAQAGACLLALQHGGPCGQVSLTRVHHAVFLRPVHPGDTLHVTARLIHADTMLALFGGQVIVNGAICAAAILEAHIHA